PEADRFQRVQELGADDFRFDPRYPDLAAPRTDDFALIEILWSVGRSVKVKRKVVADVVAALAKDPGLDPEHVMIVFKETQWENWSFAGGRLLHAEVIQKKRRGLLRTVTCCTALTAPPTKVPWTAV